MVSLSNCKLTTNGGQVVPKMVSLSNYKLTTNGVGLAHTYQPFVLSLSKDLSSATNGGQVAIDLALTGA